MTDVQEKSLRSLSRQLFGTVGLAVSPRVLRRGFAMLEIASYARVIPSPLPPQQRDPVLAESLAQFVRRPPTPVDRRDRLAFAFVLRQEGRWRGLVPTELASSVTSWFERFLAATLQMEHDTCVDSFLSGLRSDAGLVPRWTRLAQSPNRLAESLTKPREEMDEADRRLAGYQGFVSFTEQLSRLTSETSDKQLAFAARDYHADVYIRLGKQLRAVTDAFNRATSSWSGGTSRTRRKGLSILPTKQYLIGRYDYGEHTGGSALDDKRKRSLYFPESMLAEIRREAARLDRSLSWVVQRCVRSSLPTIKAMQSADADDAHESLSSDE